jgi:hypothetical protein
VKYKWRQRFLQLQRSLKPLMHKPHDLMAVVLGFSLPLGFHHTGTTTSKEVVCLPKAGAVEGYSLHL